MVLNFPLFVIQRTLRLSATDERVYQSDGDEEDDPWQWFNCLRTLTGKIYNHDGTIRLLMHFMYVRHIYLLSSHLQIRPHLFPFVSFFHVPSHHSPLVVDG